MIKKIILTTTTILLMSGCVTKEIVYQPIAQPSSVVTAVIKTEEHTFAGKTLTATPQVSQLVQQIKALSSKTAYLDLNSNQNVQVGGLLNISATPNLAGYLKLVIIDPNGDKSLVLPNSISQGYLKANQRFYSNNDGFTLTATKPTGLHYVVAIFSEQNARLIMQQGMNGYNAIRNNQDFIDILQHIKNQDYGRSHISIFPMRIY